MSRLPRGLTALVVLFAWVPLQAEPVVHKFQLWGTMKSPVEKLIFYQGWTNGFLAARGQAGLEFMLCLDDKVDVEQAIAMIDKEYKDHPENWSRPLTDEILQALTADGPCAGKNPLPHSPRAPR